MAAIDAQRAECFADPGLAPDLAPDEGCGLPVQAENVAIDPYIDADPNEFGRDASDAVIWAALVTGALALLGGLLQPRRIAVVAAAAAVSPSSARSSRWGRRAVETALWLLAPVVTPWTPWGSVLSLLEELGLLIPDHSRPEGPADTVYGFESGHPQATLVLAGWTAGVLLAALIARTSPASPVQQSGRS